MPEIGRIQSTNFQSLLTELGITRNNIPFALRSEVTPVVLVGGTVSFVAAPTPPYGVTDVFTAGNQVAPAAGFRLANTGPLPAGAYSVQVITSSEEANLFEFAWRDAADAADLWRMRMTNILTSGPLMWKLEFRLNVANDDERFVLENLNAGAVGNSYQSTILARI